MGHRAGVLVALALLASAIGPSPRAETGRDAPSEFQPQPMVSLDRPILPIPMAALDESARARVEAVLSHEIFAQRVTGIRYRSREEVYAFLLDHPDFAATVARAVRVGQYRLDRVDDTYVGDDQRGARGVLRLLHADPGRRLYYLEGRFDTPGLPTIAGEMLILLEFRHEDDGEGGTVVDQSLSGHMRIDTPVVGPLAALLGSLARPIVTQAVERKVRRFFQTVARVSRWAYDEPEQLVAVLDQNPDVPQDPTLAAFARILLADRLPAWAREPYRLMPEPSPPDAGGS